jgi:hypothetical protein
MEPPIRWISVLGSAFRAHGEIGHAGAFSVVRKRTDNSESRSAKRAGDKRIQISVVLRIEELSYALGADRHIRRDGRDGAFALLTGFYAEAELAPRRDFLDTTVVHATWERNACWEFPLEHETLLGTPFHFQDDSAGCVDNVAI